jgi:hypothetical protein
LIKNKLLFGYSVERKEQEKLWELVIETSNNLKTKAPDNIVLGLGGNYYVLQSNAVCLS